LPFDLIAAVHGGFYWLRAPLKMARFDTPRHKNDLSGAIARIAPNSQNMP
jgi:hypothetical protein